jgi:hypothetical protein
MLFAQEILEAARKLNVEALLLSSTDARKIRSMLYSSLNLKGKEFDYLWQNLSINIKKSSFDPEGWRKIASLTKGFPSMILFEESEDPNIVYLKSAEKLSQILEDCIGFVFYVLVPESQELYCFNDHNFLIEVSISSIVQ